MTHDEIQKILDTYFEAVDTKDLDTLFGLFHEDIEYIRGSQRMVGMKEFQAFYHNARPIESGQHILDHVYIVPPESAVRGRFVGALKDDTQVNIDFADFMRFQDGQVIWRKTYFLGQEV